MHRGIDLVINITSALKEELSKVNFAVTASQSGCKIKLPSHISLRGLKDCKYVDRVEFKTDASVIYASYK